MSVPQMPQKAMSTTTPSAAGSGSGNSRYSTTCRPVTSAARIGASYGQQDPPAERRRCAAWSTYRPGVTVPRASVPLSTRSLRSVGRSCPPTAIANVERYEAERVEVLRRSWLIAGRSAELADPGDFVVYEGHGETVVVTRLDDGGVAAFHNVCQHRGARLVDHPAGCAERFTCPWHGWVYDRTGDLVAVPERADFEQSSTSTGCGRRPSPSTSGTVGSGSTSPARRRARPARLDRCRHRRRSRPLRDGRHGPAREAGARGAGQLQGDRRRLQRGVPRHRAAPRRRRVHERPRGVPRSISAGRTR